MTDGGTAPPEPTTRRAVTPGQSLVLYRDEECLGGAPLARTDAPLQAIDAEAA